MTIDIINSISILELYREVWDRILKDNNNDIVFIELDWIITWWHFHGESNKLHVIVILEGQDIIGFCPFMISTGKINSELNFIGLTEASYMDFIIYDKYRERAIKTVAQHLLDLDGSVIINLHGFFEQSPNYKMLTDYLRLCKVNFLSADLKCYYTVIGEYKFDSYFKMRIGRRSRRTMNRKEKRLEKLGDIEYAPFDRRYIDDIFDLHDKRWLRKIGSSKFSQGATREFFRYLALNSGMTFKTSVDVVTFNDRIISFIYGFACGGRYIFYRIAHDDIFSIFSPGEIVFRKKIEECFGKGISVFDFGAGEEPYKAFWADHMQSINTIIFPASNPVSKAVFIKYYLLDKVKSTIKKNKFIVNFRKYKLGKIKYLLTREHICYTFGKLRHKAKYKDMICCIYSIFSGLFIKGSYYILENKLSNIACGSQNEFNAYEGDVNNIDDLVYDAYEHPAGVLRRFLDGDRCLLLEKQNKIIDCLWLNAVYIDVPGLKFKRTIKEGDVFIYYSGQNTSMLISVLNFFYAKGYKSCFAAVNKMDIYTLWKLKRLGFNSKYSIKDNDNNA